MAFNEPGDQLSRFLFEIQDMRWNNEAWNKKKKVDIWNLT